ncbi:hypothetical protein H4R21_004059 [Coemansia helicoidea]|uniref:Uncharacterized protein n=1 Tax=Coemansia helicoidea TaxID=1286919 RepID=A0ACC1KZX6_9FUNG|nr:hypothetical protein H4R21_004059 [Coemansia helicoidea]
MDMHGSSDMRRSLVLLNALYRLASSRGSDAMDGSTVHLDGHPAKHDLAEAYSHTKSLFSRMGKGYDMAALTGALEEVVAMRGKSSAFDRLLDDAGTFGDWAMGVDSGELVSEDFQTRAQKLIDQSRQALSDDERAAIRKLSTETTNYMRVVQDNPVLVEYKDAMVGLAHAITGHGLHGEERADHIDALRRDVLAMLPLLARAVRYVPLPRVAGQNKKLEFAIDNIVLDLKHFVPEHMSFGSHSEVYPRAGLLKDETASRSSHGFNGEQFFTLTIKGIHFVAKRVAFYLKKKKGLPRLADKGIADLVIGDRGMDITIHLRHLHSSEQASESQSPADGASGARRARMFDIADARVELHTLDIQVRENKHTIGGALTLALMRPVARRLIARNISHALMGALADGDRLLARYSSSAQDLVAASGRKALSSAKDAARHGSHKDSKERAPKSRSKAAAAKAASRRDSAVEAPDASATQATT